MAAVTAALVGVFAFIILRVTAPQMSPVFTDLTPEDSAAIVKDLERQGIAYELKNDGAIVMVQSLEDADEVFESYRPRLRDTGYLWLITPKRGREGYVNQMALVPGGKRHGLIDNKTCSIDEERSGIRFVVPRALRGRAHSAAA